MEVEAIRSAEEGHSIQISEIVESLSKNKHSYDFATLNSFLSKSSEAQKCLITGFVVWCFAAYTMYMGWVYHSQATIAMSLISWFEGGCIFANTGYHISNFYSPTWNYTYGHGQLEVVIVFSNCCCLLFTVLYTLIETSEHTFFQHYANESIPVKQLCLVTFLGRFVGVACLRTYSRAYQNMPDYFKISSLKYIIAELTQRYFGSGRVHRSILLIRISAHIVSSLACWMVLCLSLHAFANGDKQAELFGSFFICAGIISSIFPMFFHNSKILLLTVPSNASHLQKCLRDISNFEGVLEVRNEHFWQCGYDKNIGSLHIRVRRDVDTSAILAKIQATLAHIVSHLVVQFFQDDWQMIIQ